MVNQPNDGCLRCQIGQSLIIGEAGNKQVFVCILNLRRELGAPVAH